MKFKRQPIFLLGLTVSLPLFAQVQPEAGSLLQQQKQLEQQQVPEQKTPIIKEEVKPVTPKAGEVRVHVTAFEIEGDPQAFTKVDLLKVLDGHIGSDMSLGELQQAAGLITNYYRDRGYFLARAYLPQQDVTSGAIRIAVLEGNLQKDGVKIEGQKIRLNESRMVKTIETASKPETPLTQLGLERGVLLINDLPGMAVSANLAEGKEPGNTSITLDTKEGEILTGHGTLDNYGSRFTGLYRAVAGLELNDPLHVGDQATAEFTQSLDGDFKYFRAGYSIPIAYSGLRVGLNAGALSYGVGKEMASLALKGKAQEMSFDGKYPLIRSQAVNWWISGTYAQQSLYNESAGVQTSDKQVSSTVLGTNFDRIDQLGGGGILMGSLSWTHGNLDLSRDAASLSADQGAGGAGTNGGFSKTNWSLSRTQRSVNRLTLIAQLSGQIAYKNLDSGQKMSLGGPTGVRAYPAGEGSGDDGLRATLEARYLAKAGTKMGDWNVIGFWDWGQIVQNHDQTGITMTTPNRYKLSGYGVGLTVGKPGKYDVNFAWAHVLGDNPGRNATTGANADGLTDKSRLWVAMHAFF